MIDLVPFAFNTDAAARLAHELYGIDASASPLPGERDRNFLLHGAHAAFVLKLSHAADDAALLECQHAMLARLAAETTRYRFPRPLPSRHGELFEYVRLPDGTGRLVRLLEHVPGEPLAHITQQEPALLEDVGRMMGVVDRALHGFAHPAAHRTLQWDLKQGRAVVARELEAITAPARRALVEHFSTRFDDHAAPHLTALRTGVIHGDANDWNVLVDTSAAVQPTGAARTAGSDSVTAVTGLIDFGDVVHSWIVAEPAIAAAYVMLGKDDPLGAAAHVLRGYHAEFALTDAELAAVYPLICLRLCTSVVLSARQRAAQPDNAYLSISEDGAWRLLERLRHIEPDQARAVLRDACRPRAARNAIAAIGASGPPLAARDSADALRAVRARLIGPNLSLSYRRPLHIVRGWMQHLYDDDGNVYLDCVNNVAHVGHCHPHVVSAIARQSALLNTNTRYLHENLTRYAERLTATLPEPLSVCFFVCSGSEANELALRLARAHTARHDVIVLDAAYHGNTGALVDLSPYKLRGAGGHAAPPGTHIVPLPDPYRGRYRGDTIETAQQYAAHVRAALERAAYQRGGIAAFLFESLPGCGGQIVLPRGYLGATFAHVRAAGGVCIADEVQVGFGRVGSHFWGFETHDVVPDIVTMGKPMGNGHPVGAVVTTPEIAASFANGMEYFNTFGGNPVSCAAGLAVLDVIAEERLQQRALEVGTRLNGGLAELKSEHELIGDVRGRGLYIGMELVRDRDTLEPAADEAARVIERMRERGVLLSTDGPLHNVIKIKPPLQFAAADADLVVARLDEVLRPLA
ncbi:MAG TPA: aminotransferase class III-fold pyridoxal phosphate-dependent enzyme [Longimicrobiales bacterium]|nr:aminotransferase class III-fold pyridoxal phosphate-dependent enzyme [Longimicrobiales bacterium]